MIRFLRVYNIVVLAVLVFFQSPVFLCPTGQDMTLEESESAKSKLYYIPASECKE